MRPTTKPTAASSRLLDLLDSDLPDHALDRGRDGWARFVTAKGPVLEVAARVERRFLGRTEVAVLSSTYEYPGGDFEVAVSHRGKMRRSGLAARVRTGGERAVRLAEALEADHGLAEAAHPLDFTRFIVAGEGRLCRATVELAGASHVSIAFPPIRSYVRLFPDQREALLATFAELGRLLTE